MGVPAARTVVRWALLLAVIAGVLGMHHLVPGGDAAHHGQPAAAAVDAAEHHGANAAGQLPAGGGFDLHDVLHLCLAILGIGAGIGAVLVLFRRLLSIPGHGPPVSPCTPAITAPERPPPRRTGRDILHRHCVIRV
ncbi:DUF6153 family protein [Haloechinothrix sp. LS1_15]|uniref:DUF6153 family protein n=1 Tax=Haloechinothrix sp. LS1_15 TaxID=2652248 RepID=UPI0029482927|nr:DUF6153 family protein [Haloechinothrix sp. LS1_15]MDV6011839.1 hypothetical protein [Haloechinothrix sp. LS1_15]